MRSTTVNKQASVRMFVAMPGTTMGEHAEWNDPDEIKAIFYCRIQSDLALELGRDVELVVERDKDEAGSIYNSMYQECWDADVYIADLTGSNPNVYLELGARWALRERVTVVVSQNIERLEFNVQSSRSIRYSKRSLEAAVGSVVRTIIQGLSSSKPDNPVREAIDAVTLPRFEYEQLIREKVRSALLSRELSESYVSAGLLEREASDSFAYFQKAIEVDPSNPRGWLAMAEGKRRGSNYVEAVGFATDGLNVLPGEALLHREKGLALSKLDRIDEAIYELSTAVELAPKIAEFFSNLGGAWRRKAFASAEVGRFHVPSAMKSRDCYAKARLLAEQDVSRNASDELAYALGNVARLDFVLSNFVPDRVPPPTALTEAFRRLREICRETLRVNPNDYYRQFDLADSYLLAGETEEGIKLYRAGAKMVPSGDPDALLSASTPLRQYLKIGCGDKNMRSAMETIAKDLEHAASLLRA